MLTYTSARNLMGTLTGDSGTTNLANMDILHNEMIREVITKKPWGFRQKTSTISTVASQQAYNLPADCSRVVNVSVTIGTTKYTPRRVKSRDDWDRLNQNTSVSSDTPEYYFVFGKTLLFYPIPATATSSAITFTYERSHRDLSVADYTSGTIVSVAAGGTAVVGSSTTWTAAMAGRYLRITDADAANKGDGKWYEISSVSSTTALTLVNPYQGTAISAGAAAYTIGQTSFIPEEFHMLPVYKAVEIYWSTIQPELDRANYFKERALEMEREMQAECGSMGI